MLRPYKQLFIIAFSWKVAIARHLIDVILQGSRNPFCSPSDTWCEPATEASKFFCLLHNNKINAKPVTVV